eukprot:UN11926
MMHIILLSTLIIIGKSMVTTHEKCGTTHIFAPAIEACCNDIVFIKATQSCCNGVVIDGSCSGSTPGMPVVPLPSGPRLIIRSNVSPVDADVEDVFG